MALLAEVEPKCLGKLIVQGGWGVVSCGNYVVGLFVFFFFFFFFFFFYLVSEFLLSVQHYPVLLTSQNG